MGRTEATLVAEEVGRSRAPPFEDEEFPDDLFPCPVPVPWPPVTALFLTTLFPNLSYPTKLEAQIFFRNPAPSSSHPFESTAFDALANKNFSTSDRKLFRKSTKL